MVTNNKDYNDTPLVSAIITTYKREKKILKRAIDSVLTQTYSNIELIVVDDNGSSTDYHNMVRELVKEYSKIKLIVHNSNQGAQVARNNGIAASNGELIAFLDDDDEWLPEKIELQVSKMERNENIAIVYCWNYLITENRTGIVSKKVIKRPEYNKKNVLSKLLRSNFIGSNSFPLLRKEYVLEVGGYDCNMTSAQDVDLWIRLSSHYDVSCVEKPLVNYYNHSGDRITNDFKRNAKNTKYFYEKYKNYFDKDKVALSNLTKGLATSYIGNKQHVEGRDLLLRSYKYNPTFKNFIYVLYNYTKTYVMK